MLFSGWRIYNAAPFFPFTFPKEITLGGWLGGALPVVRTMPNTPALLGAGITGLHASALVDGDGRAFAEALLAAENVREAEIDKIEETN